MKRLFIFAIIFIFIFSFSSSAETVTKHIDFSNLTDDELNSVCSDTYKDYSFESTDNGIKFIRVNNESRTAVSHCTIKISDYIEQYTKDIVINELTLDTISSGNFNIGIKLNNSPTLYWLDTTSQYQPQFRTGTYLDFSLLGTYIPNNGFMAGGNSGSPIIIDETNLQYVTHIIFFTPNVDSNITVNGLNFLGEPITTTTISPTTIPGQTGNIISPDDMGLNIWNGMTNNSGNLIIVLSVALSIIGVFIAIKIALNLFHEGVK